MPSSDRDEIRIDRQGDENEVDEGFDYGEVQESEDAPDVGDPEERERKLNALIQAKQALDENLEDI